MHRVESCIPLLFLLLVASSAAVAISSYTDSIMVCVRIQDSFDSLALALRCNGVHKSVINLAHIISYTSTCTPVSPFWLTHLIIRITMHVLTCQNWTSCMIVCLNGEWLIHNRALLLLVSHRVISPKILSMSWNFCAMLRCEEQTWYACIFVFVYHA